MGSRKAVSPWRGPGVSQAGGLGGGNARVSFEAGELGPLGSDNLSSFPSLHLLRGGYEKVRYVLPAPPLIWILPPLISICSESKQG